MPSTSNMWRCETGYNLSEFHVILNRTQHWIEDREFSTGNIIIMTFCVIGVVGNLLNLLMLSAKRCVRKLKSLEDNANLILCVLAVSDLLFCVVAFMYSFTKGIPYLVREVDVFFLQLQYYGHASISLCLMSSTYMVVLLAVERYVAMYYPIQTKILGKPCSTMWLIVLVIVLCVCATLPYFINNVIAPCYSVSADQVLYEWIPRWQHDDLLVGYMTCVWPALSVFIPLTVVFFCNIRLVQGLQKVTSSRKYQVTLILIVIVFLSVILVIPAEIIKLINPYETWGDIAYIIAPVVNAMQTGNFAINFFLYCVLDKEYRQVCRAIFCCRKTTSHTSDSRNVMPLVRTSRTKVTFSGRCKSNRTFV